ncbi:hypothetical protein AAFF_G00396190 [Aldrovandia affinis]|uniref:Uncharacterized protein n=1 Tax=Aldrovandia affinis TaxID=143900 RepID=A0AAD7SDC5_9TELE|nr:hypothetical protein AAFF_G00396190 [Aldrovandia affinis]
MHDGVPASLYFAQLPCGGTGNARQSGRMCHGERAEIRPHLSTATGSLYFIRHPETRLSNRDKLAIATALTPAAERSAYINGGQPSAPLADRCSPSGGQPLPATRRRATLRGWADEEQE